MEQTSKNLVKFWIDQIVEYARSDGMKIDPLPALQIVDGQEQQNSKDDLLISTGGYVPSSKTVILYTDNRHLKDIVRSYCHELVHHMQNLDNPDYFRRVAANSTSVVGDKQLEEIEGDAYLRGNLLLRKFTEHFKDQHKEDLQ